MVEFESLRTWWDALVDWIQQDLGRPVWLLVSAMLLFNLPTVLYKVRMSVRGIAYFVLCWDKSWKTPRDPGSIFGPHLSRGLPVERKTIYFVRHGESTWNDTFNKGKHRSVLVFALGFLPGLVKAVLYEIYLLLSGKMDSWFYDAPLNSVGLSQIEDMHQFLVTCNTENSSSPESEHVKILRADPGTPNSKILCSNLRRAASTVAAGFRDRLSRRPDDKILVLECLQEISRNPDTLSITPPHTPIQASWMEKGYPLCDFQDIFNSQTDMSLHEGNKPLSTNGLLRMTDFCQFVFGPSVPERHVIVGGHSIWFRSFFNNFLPFSVHHVSKQKKIVNGGIVTFELLKASTSRGPSYMIDPKTIRVIYGGF